MLKFIVDVLNTLLPFLYGALLYLYGRVFWEPQSSEGDWIRPALWLVIGLHITEIAARAWLIGYVPLANLPQIASVLALSILIIYAYIELRIKLPTTGVFVLTSVLLLQLYSSLFMLVEADFPPILSSRLFLLHTGSAMLSYAAFYIAAIYGLMYILLFRQMKKAQFGKMYSRMPNLEQLNEMNNRAILPGFLLLTMAVLVGILWRKALDPFAAHFDPKVTSIYAVWLIYGILTIGSISGKWNGRWMATGAVAAFVLLLGTFWAVNLFSSSFHRFY